MMHTIAVLALILATGAVARAGGESPAEYAYVPADGPFEVQTSDAQWIDARRNRTVLVRLYAPVHRLGESPMPVIILSHGLGGSREGYGYLAAEFAARGYLCVVPSHPGSDTAEMAKNGWIELFRSLSVPNNRIERTRDISFIIDRLTAKDLENALLKGRVDERRIGVAGHSFGAYTALSAVGQRGETPEERAADIRDARVKAALAMSPQHPGKMGLNEFSWNDIRVPAMTMTGTKDIMPGTSDASERRYPFAHMPPGDKYHFLIREAEHAAFSDNMIGPVRAQRFLKRDPRHHEWIRMASVAFFDAYLKDSPTAKNWLTAGAIEKYTSGEATMERR